MFAQITVTVAGDPTNVLAQFQRLDIFPAPVVGAPNPLWCHQPAPGRNPHTTEFPAGGFFPGVSCVAPAAPTPVVFDEEAALARHRVGPAQQVPEPASAALLGLGSTLVAFGRRRRAAA